MPAISLNSMGEESRSLARSFGGLVILAARQQLLPAQQGATSIVQQHQLLTKERRIFPAPLGLFTFVQQGRTKRTEGRYGSFSSVAKYDLVLTLSE